MSSLGCLYLGDTRVLYLGLRCLGDTRDVGQNGQDYCSVSEVHLLQLGIVPRSEVQRVLASVTEVLLVY
jgi:hypothetical protein